MPLYHTTLLSNAQYILKNGLNPSKKTLWSDWSEEGYVYFSKTPNDSLHWLIELWYKTMNKNIEDICILSINVDGLGIEPDVRNTFKYKGVIPPNRISKFKTISTSTSNSGKKLSLNNMTIMEPKHIAMEGFINSLKREGNESLIETILEGHQLLFESREGGKKLSDYPRYQYLSKVSIFRATTSDKFNTDDYVTLSGKFAIEHAENNHIVNEVQNHVIKAIVQPDLIVDANNAGEYFYKGEPIKGEIVYSSKGYDYEGDIPILEGKTKSEFAKLKENKVPLTDEERKEVIKKKAVWNDNESAVWKSKNRNGKITYITHTHRAYNTAPTLKGAIGRFHDFIKGTA